MSITNFPTIPPIQVVPATEFIVRTCTPKCFAPATVPSGYRHLSNEIDPIGAQRIPHPDAPVLLLSDNPETVPGFPANDTRPLWRWVFSEGSNWLGPLHVRIFLWHLWAPPTRDTAKFGFYLSNSNAPGNGAIKISRFVGHHVLELNSIPAKQEIRNMTAHCLNGTLPTRSVPGYTLGTAIQPGTKLTLLEVDRSWRASERFFGALYELTIEAVGSEEAEQHVFAIYDAADKTDIRNRTGMPKETTFECSNPGDSPWLGHARGNWPSGDINIPGTENIPQVSDDADEWTQITLGNSACEPYGGDMLAFPGQVAVTPFEKSNKVLFAVNQRVRIPLENPTDDNAMVEGYFGCPANISPQELRGAVSRVGQPELETFEIPGSPGFGIPVFSVAVPAKGSATAAFDVQMAGGSSYPAAVFLKGVGTTTTTTTSSTSTTTTSSTTTSSSTTSSSTSSTSNTTSSTTSTTSTSTTATTTTTTSSTTSTTSSTSSTGTGTFTLTVTDITVALGMVGSGQQSVQQGS